MAFNPELNDLKRVIASGLDGKTTGSTLIYSVPSSKKFAIDYIRFRGNSISGFVTAPTLKIGFNNPDYDNLLPATTLTTVSATDFVLSFPLATAFIPPSGVGVYVNLTVAANATTYLYDIHLKGDWF